MELDELARALSAVDDQALSVMGRWTPLPVGAFGGAGPGRLGDVGRALASQHDAAIVARRAEAEQVMDVIDDLADTVATAAANYCDLEDRRAGQR